MVDVAGDAIPGLTAIVGKVVPIGVPPIEAEIAAGVPDRTPLNELE